MRTSVLLTCVAACLAAGGCNTRWEFKWPDWRGAKDDGETKTPTSRPAGAGITPRQEIAQLRRQVKTLRERLDVIENENADLRQSNQSVKELQKKLEQLTFTAKMQAEDLKILKTAAIERDLHKTRSERLQREVRNLNARIVNLLKKLAAADVGANPGKATATKPSGTRMSFTSLRPHRAN